MSSLKILFISLGCDKNLVDSEKMLGKLAGQGYELTDEETEADVIIVKPFYRKAFLCFHIITRQEHMMCRIHLIGVSSEFFVDFQ